MKFEAEADNPEPVRRAAMTEAGDMTPEDPNERWPSPGENHHLCWKCQAALSSATPSQDITHLDSQTQNGLQSMRAIEAPGSVQTTARAGCPLCHRFVGYLSSTEQNLLRSWPEEKCRTKYEYSGFSHRFMHASLRLTTFLPFDEVGASEDEREPPSVSSCVELQPAQDVDDCLNTGKIEASTDSDSTWSTIKTWLADCTQHHTLCSSARPGPLPTRVIEITPGQPLKLVLASHLGSPADYATLSHCWGSHMPLRLLTSNLSSLMREIPMEKLSRTFQHAVTIARRMDVSYLWIDSLCIIQDSPPDWLAESATMASVYSHAAFNISAAHASDGKGGCFTARDPAVLTPLHVHVPWAGWGTSPGSRAVLERYWWHRHVDAAPLLQRAWVFQEQVLSRRNVIFGNTEVLFVCRETVASEQFPSGIPERVVGPELREAGMWLHDQEERGDDTPEREDDGGGAIDGETRVLDLWDALVDEFAKRNLTRGTDKLVAFSAVASQMHRHMRSDYLAGLWRVHLPGQLLWCINSMDTEPQPRPSEGYVAPSWSWASTSGKVMSRFPKFAEMEEVLEIVRAEVVPVDAGNCFGQVKSAALRARGYLARTGPLSRGGTSFGGESEEADADLCFNVDWDCKLEPGQDGEDAYYLLPVLADYTTKDEVGAPGSLTSVYGLVLRRICASKDEYVREGRFDVVRWKRAGFQAACREFAAEMGVGEGGNGWGGKHLLSIL